VNQKPSIESTAAKATDTYLDTLIEFVDLAPSHNADIDLDAAADELQRALKAQASTAEVERATSDARAVVDRVMATANQGAGFSEMIRRALRQQLAGVRLSLDELACQSGSRAKLTAAEKALAVAEAELSASRVEMNDAIERGDVQAVLALREELELSLPAKVAAARVEVLDHRLAVAEAAAMIPAARTEAAARRLTACESDVEVAKEALARAQAALLTAQRGVILPSSAVGKATATVEQLSAERNRAAQAAELDQKARLRALAGLPPAPISMAKIDSEAPSQVVHRPNQAAQPAFAAGTTHAQPATPEPMDDGRYVPRVSRVNA
jgi:hypothetical protein